MGFTQTLPGWGGLGDGKWSLFLQVLGERNAYTWALLFRILAWPLPGWVALGKLFTSLIPHPRGRDNDDNHKHEMVVRIKLVNMKKVLKTVSAA